MSLVGKILSGAIAFTASLSQNKTNGSALDAFFPLPRIDIAQKLNSWYVERVASISLEGGPTRELD